MAISSLHYVRRDARTATTSVGFAERFAASVAVLLANAHTHGWVLYLHTHTHTHAHTPANTATKSAHLRDENIWHRTACGAATTSIYR